MPLEIYLKAVVACLIGNILHVTAKVLILWKDHKNANLEFNLVQYFKDDKIPIGCDAIFSFGVVYLLDEIIGYIPWAVDYVKAFFVLLGFGGSYLILNALSTAEKNLRKAIKYKANISDQATGTTDKPTPK